MSLIGNDHCDQCDRYIRDELEPEFELFYQSILKEAEGNHSDDSENGLRDRLITPASFKYLVVVALSMMPSRELDLVQDTLEWVLNPEHEQDLRAISILRCDLFQASHPFAFAWTALGRRIHEESGPYLLFFLGASRFTFMVPIPLCVVDDEDEGETRDLPMVGDPCAFQERPADFTHRRLAIRVHEHRE